MKVHGHLGALGALVLNHVVQVTRARQDLTQAVACHVQELHLSQKAVMVNQNHIYI